MRNALGLMLASVVTAVLITGVWFWTSSPRADAAPPQTVAARKAEPLPAPAAAKLAVDETAESEAAKASARPTFRTVVVNSVVIVGSHWPGIASPLLMAGACAWSRAPTVTDVTQP